jgi:hypothetical protein
VSGSYYGKNQVNGFAEAGVWPVGRNIPGISILLQALRPSMTAKEVLPKRTTSRFSSHIYVGTICSLQKAVSAVQRSRTSQGTKG